MSDRRAPGNLNDCLDALCELRQFDVPCRVTELPDREGAGEDTEQRRIGTSVPLVIRKTQAGDRRGCQRLAAPVYKG